MKLHNEFTVPLAPQETWDLLNQVERVAPCFPGAQLLEARDDGGYVGTVSMRLGPVALSFRGTAVYEEVDSDAMRVKASAKGNEQRARGSARADVEFQVTPDRDGSRVLIDTDLQLVGSIAQYARGGGMIETTAQVMIDDFANNLKAQLAAEQAAEAAAAEDATEGGGATSATSSDPLPVTPPAVAKPPSLLRILWLALKLRLFGKSSK